jgi:quinol monooxygenase YgiN
MHIHLAITEAVGDEQVREVLRIIRERTAAIADTPDFVSLHVDVEDSGTMILITTVWRTREALISYASSRLYRQIIAATQHLLVGDFVVKVFKREAAQ